MKRAQGRMLWVAATVSLVSGLAYAYMRYLMRGDDPFSAYNHPAQPWALDLHILTAPVLLFAVGWFWGNHVVPKLRRGVRAARRSGTWLLALVGLMTLSGYLLQTFSGPAWRAAAGWVHGTSGTVFFGLLLGHLVAGRAAADPGPGEPRTAEREAPAGRGLAP